MRRILLLALTLLFTAALLPSMADGSPVSRQELEKWCGAPEAGAPRGLCTYQYIEDALALVRNENSGLLGTRTQALLYLVRLDTEASYGLLQRDGQRIAQAEYTCMSLRDGEWDCISMLLTVTDGIVTDINPSRVCLPKRQGDTMLAELASLGGERQYRAVTGIGEPLSAADLYWDGMAILTLTPDLAAVRWGDPLNASPDIIPEEDGA